MTKKYREELRAALGQRQREIFARLHNLETGWQQLGEPVIEMEEQAQQAELSELFDRLDRQGQEQVEEISRALDKMDAGTYGVCENCATTIPPARLRALPATRYCLACSREQEGQPLGTGLR